MHAHTDANIIYWDDSSIKDWRTCNYYGFGLSKVVSGSSNVCIWYTFLKDENIFPAAKNKNQQNKYFIGSKEKCVI